ncbi:hypothetical protein MXB_2970, partial [Myxobolus squamalis]
IKISNLFGYTVSLNDHVQIQRLPGGEITDSKLVEGVTFLTDIYLSSMPRSFNSPRILILKSIIDPERIKKSCEVNQKNEYILNCVKRILIANPNLIFFGDNLSNVALQEFAMRQITVICNTSESIMKAISLSTNATILNSIEEIPFVQLGTCDSFKFETITSTSNKYSFLILDKCPLPCYFSVILRSLPSSQESTIRQILQYAIFGGFYAKQEFSFLKTLNS